MKLYIWLTILLMSLVSGSNALAQQSPWISDLDQSKRLGKYGPDKNLEHSVQYCVKALGEARQMQSATVRDVALDQIHEQFQHLQYQFDSASRWDWAEQVTKWLLDIDLKNHPAGDTYFMNNYKAASDYGKLAKYAVMQGRTAEGEKYAAREKELKEQPLREAKRQAAELQGKFERQIEQAKATEAKAAQDKATEEAKATQDKTTPSQ